jgi:hypothetical protein
MRAAAFFLLPVLLTWLPAFAAGGSQPRTAADCREWNDCRRLALEAAERRDYETFHDLAWRAVQTGPRNDPALMYLLARAQVLSGRPHDALIMIQRLAEIGIASDASTNDDFERMRALPDWPAVEALIARVRGTGSGTDLATVKNRSSSLSAVVEPSAVEQAVRISIPRFAPGGLAYDAVSGRFVIGDLHARKLIIVQDGADHAVDLVGAASAGFHEIRAIEIDTRQGDLWVATATPEDEEWSLHRLQLVSGRLLKALPIDASLGPMKLVDLAVTPAGTIVALDAAGKRLLELRPKGTSLQPLLDLAIENPTSLAATNDEVVYVAGGGGVERVDLRSRSAAPVSVPSGFALANIERIRWYRNALMAATRNGNESRRVVRLDLNASGRAMTSATVIDATMPATAGAVFMTVSGDYLSYVVDADPRGQSRNTPVPRIAEFVVRRIRLR